jgi:hypothetical protein
MSAEPTATLVDLFRRMEARLAVERTVETFANVRGRMTPGPVFVTGQEVSGDPLGPVPVPVDPMFV